jgi:hypothetical protein
MAGTIDLADPDELPRMAAMLSRHLRTVHQTRDAAGPAADVIRHRADRAVDTLRQRAEAAEAALRNAPDEAAARAAAVLLAEANARLRAGRALSRRLSTVLDELAQAVRAHVRVIDAAGEPGIDRLGRFWTGLTGATASFRAQLRRFGRLGSAGTGARLSGSGSSAAGGPGPASAMRATLDRLARTGIGPPGHVLVSLRDIDVSDSPVRGQESFQHVPMNEMREGLLLLDRILAAVADGADRDEMRRLDEGTARSVTHLRVYEAFFGDTAIRLVRRTDGRFEVVNGYHRIWLARLLGIDELPARVEGLS